MGNQTSEQAKLSEKLLFYKCRIVQSGTLNHNNNGQIIEHIPSKRLFYLKHRNFMNRSEFQSAYQLSLRDRQKSQLNQFILLLIEVWKQETNNLCSESLKLYTLYQYSTITLKDQIRAKKVQRKDFTCDYLWMILHSCVNAMDCLYPKFVFDTNKVYLLGEGKLKILNCPINEQELITIQDLEYGEYYAPQKTTHLRSFMTNSSTIATPRSSLTVESHISLQKETIFSLGMTLLETAVLQGLSCCYDYRECQFDPKVLQSYLEVLHQKYETLDLRLVDLICGMVEVNPARRLSLKMIKNIIVKKSFNRFVKGGTRRIKDFKQNRHLLISLPCDMICDMRLKQRKQGYRQTKHDEKENIDCQPTQKKKYNEERKEPFAKSFILNDFSQHSTDEVESRSSLSSESVFGKFSVTQNQSSRALAPYLPHHPSFSLQQSKSLSKPHKHLNNNPKNVNYAKENSETLFTDSKILEIIQDFKKQKRINCIDQLSKCRQYFHPMPITIIGQEQSLLLSMNSETLRSQTGSIPNITAIFHQIQPPEVGLSPTDSSLNLQKIQKKSSSQEQTPSEGYYYEGCASQGMRQGFGRLRFPDMRYYEGQFHNNTIEGYGTYYNKNTIPIYIGFWKNNLYHGYGVLYNQTIIQQPHTNSYDYRSFNHINNQAKYEGQFYCGKKQGKGTLTLSNGESFTGNWRDNFVDGQGCFRNLYGDRIRGKWLKGILIKELQPNEIDENKEEISQQCTQAFIFPITL